MLEIFNKEEMNAPIKLWLADEKDLEESFLEQAYHLSQLPFIHKWVALMPDTHRGVGIPIGGVIATKGVILPNAVGVDIGCGMCFASTDIKVADLKRDTANGSLIQCIVADILRNIPVGFKKHKEKQSSKTIDKAYQEIEKYEKNPELIVEFDQALYQLGTLGGGNHFIELQEDEEGFLGIMIHSGSRHLGKVICDAFDSKAKELNQKYYSSVPSEHKLAFLPVSSEEGKQYIQFMNLALDFAKENRDKMMSDTQKILERWLVKHLDREISYSMEINCHHNYASIENHYGENVWVHRKGATRAREGELVVIPGAMGSYSYVAQGLGNPLSFHSSSHGAGRRFSRKTAMSHFRTEEVILDLREKDVVLGKANKKDVAEESRFAYKDIDEVMENQKDLVLPVKKLKTIAVVKG